MQKITTNNFGYLWITIICLLAAGAKAQDFFDDDARFWLYTKLNKNWTKKLETEFILQHRFHNNIADFSQINGNVEVKYRVSKAVKLIGGGVYGLRRKMTGRYGERYQVYGGFRVKQKINYFTIVYRNLVQAQMSENDVIRKRGANFYDRNKLTLKYELSKRFEIYTAGEVNLPVSIYGPAYINRFRWFSGLVYTINRNSYLQTYFLFQRKYGYDRLPPRDFIYGLTYGYNLR